jgi:sensor histidine kinase YesM
MRPVYSPRNIRPFIRINLIIAIALCVIFCPSCFTSWEGLKSIADDFVYSFIISMLLSGGISEIVRFSDRHFPWLEKPVQRLVFDIAVVIAYSFIVAFILASVFSLLVWDYFTLENFNVEAMLESTKTPILIALIITAFFTSRSFLIEWKRAAIETEKIKNEKLESQYQGLKDQLNPHFLFNSLNVLSNLVYEDADKANRFIEQLSRIYRYVLEVQNEEFVTLETELSFANSYMELQKTRFGEKFLYEVNVSDAKDYGIAPLSLQLLLENAFKHNAATRDKPLQIWIAQHNDQLIVKNNIQKRESNGTGLGLNNITERTKHLTGKPIQIDISEEYFTVTIPLYDKI